MNGRKQNCRGKEATDRISEWGRKLVEQIKNPVSIKKHASTHCWGRVSTPEKKVNSGKQWLDPARKGSGILMIGIMAGQRRKEQKKRSLNARFQERGSPNNGKESTVIV
jgi:3'-phosphoadenosine 5'-phosphosulfate sulfotransferase (PAPS reductase)/FAD synthetase